MSDFLNFFNSFGPDESADIIDARADKRDAEIKLQAEIEAEAKAESDAIHAEEAQAESAEFIGEAVEPEAKEEIPPSEKTEFNFSLDYVKAGRARFTVSNPQGKHYTYRVTPVPQKDGAFFVALLTGPDNRRDYTYMALLTKENKAIFTKKSCCSERDLPAKVFMWAVKVATGKARLPEGYSIDHSGRCGRCGKELTETESIQTGLGPYCRSLSA